MFKCWLDGSADTTFSQTGGDSLLLTARRLSHCSPDLVQEKSGNSALIKGCQAETAKRLFTLQRAGETGGLRGESKEKEGTGWGFHPNLRFRGVNNFSGRSYCKVFSVSRFAEIAFSPQLTFCSYTCGLFRKSILSRFEDTQKYLVAV